MIEFDYSDNNIANTIEKDYFGRNIYLTNLIKTVNSIENYTAFSVDGKWGAGKTVFMHQFLYLLKNQDKYDQINGVVDGVDVSQIEGFYYNAWENELMKNPSICILNSLIDEYSIFSSEDRRKASELFDVIKKITIKLGTAGILSADDFETSQEHDDNNLNATKVRDVFDELIEKIKRKKNVEKIVIVIDELDRCKPTYAVEFLEEIKHFYSNKDLCIIFSTNLDELANTISGLYGFNFDAGLYLQRFFDAVFTLNSCNYERYINEELLYNISNTYVVNESCKIAISIQKLSIRGINKFIKQIKAINNQLVEQEAFSKETEIAKFVFVPWGIAAKYSGSEAYRRFINGEITKDEISKYINLSKDFPEWLSECLLQNHDKPEGFDIENELYEMYKHIFKMKDFNFHNEPINSDIRGKKVRSLVEF